MVQRRLHRDDRVQERGLVLHISGRRLVERARRDDSPERLLYAPPRRAQLLLRSPTLLPRATKARRCFASVLSAARAPLRAVTRRPIACRSAAAIIMQAVQPAVLCCAKQTQRFWGSEAFR